MDLSTRLRRFYAAHDPDLNNSEHVAAVAEYYVDEEAVLFEALYRKYVAPRRAQRAVAVPLQRRWRRRRAARVIESLLSERAAELDGPWVLVPRPR